MRRILANKKAQFLLNGERVDVELAGEGADEPASSILLAQGGMVWELTPWRKDGSHGGHGGDGAIL